MTAPLQDDDAALAKLQRETAQIDLELKKRELADKSSKWAIFRNPAVFVPISAAIASGIFGLIVASFQVYEDREKLQEQVNTSILIDALNGYPRNTTFDPAQSATLPTTEPVRPTCRPPLAPTRSIAVTRAWSAVGALRGRGCHTVVEQPDRVPRVRHRNNVQAGWLTPP